MKVFATLLAWMVFAAAAYVVLAHQLWLPPQPAADMDAYLNELLRNSAPGVDQGAGARPDLLSAIVRP
ncbi:MAG: hypothetical protein KGK00_11135 [Paracoccaceae bacterium]|nr:hypothetical protein [Paracoccaceae bacterium]